ncbi:MAG TPA: hypothetical protein VIY48_11195 [Candidatus Paceibacterota bacterium]
MHVISAALSYAASDVYFSFTAGDPYEDAEMELKEEMLDKAIRKYAPFIPEETDKTKNCTCSQTPGDGSDARDCMMHGDTISQTYTLQFPSDQEVSES